MVNNQILKQESKAPTNDIKSKTIFKNPVLCCQFLRNYVNHPTMKNIQPEDIEDYTDRFTSYFGVEFEADTVKKIHILNGNGEKSEIFLISLIEHKTEVDYNVIVQLLKYMTCIWAEYEKQFGTDYKDKVKTKEFRYPPILPVVYHEGSDTWTAPMHLKDRIFMSELFESYIPDFTYCLVDNHRFSNKELLERQDEMSLIMLLNKIQTKADLSEFVHIPDDEINRIVKESPEAVIDIIVMVMTALCTKLNLSRQDTEECVKKVRTRDMGYLWANMEKIDVQASQAEVAKAKAALIDIQAKLSEKQVELDEKQVELDEKQAEIERLKAILETHGITQE
ncbi:MAG: Rpn family recombination-promoting nuclease/putative transposase [Lachnospiraceae bacterium]|nr:Rpn family recombination-promoting nuclease/putative transposase [Lachnospiraceae bacterium]